MKTLDEAVAVAFCAAPDTATAAANMHQLRARYNSIAEELVEHPTVKLCVGAIFEGVVGAMMAPESEADGGDVLRALRDALVTCLINGCVIGMEMERQEEVGTRADSQPAGGVSESNGYTGV